MQRYGFVLASFVVACGPPTNRGGGDDGVDAPTGPTVDAPACAATSVTATEVLRPVDILWVIDNSGSMSAEESRVQNNMNNFATSISNSGVDYRVVVVTDTSHVNVPPPLGVSAEYLGVNLSIGSNDALQKLVQSYASYQTFLRPTSVKHIVVVTDDESDWSASMFETQLAALTAPGFGTDWRFHAVVAEDPPFDFNSHCFTLAAAVGNRYLQLRVAHGGEFFSLCDTNWTPLFTTLAQSVTQGLALPCTFDLPEPPGGQALDPTKVNFVYTPTGGAPTTVGNVGNAAACGANGGWYYDDPSTPSQIVLCPTTCGTLEGDPTGNVTIEHGCSTVIL